MESPLETSGASDLLEAACQQPSPDHDRRKGAQEEDREEQEEKMQVSPVGEPDPLRGRGRHLTQEEVRIALLRAPLEGNLAVPLHGPEVSRLHLAVAVGSEG